jgi:hypothetical protein
MLTLDASEPLARAITDAIQTGNLDELKSLLAGSPELARATIVRRNRCGEQSRSLLHIATDYPGHFPNAEDTVRVLIAAGADVNARYSGHTARHPFTGRPAATTSASSMRCSRRAPTSRPTARSSTAAHRSPTPSPSGSGTPHADCWSAERPRREEMRAGGRRRATCLSQRKWCPQLPAGRGLGRVRIAHASGPIDTEPISSRANASSSSEGAVRDPCGRGARDFSFRLRLSHKSASMALRCRALQRHLYRGVSHHRVEPTCRPIDALYGPVVGLFSNARDLCDSLAWMRRPRRLPRGESVPIR